MSKLRVDLLLVGGTVCYTAKEKLLKRGIALAVGVKPQVLERVARCTNTPVLLSPAQVLSATPGTCGRGQASRCRAHPASRGQVGRASGPGPHVPALSARLTPPPPIPTVRTGS